MDCFKKDWKNPKQPHAISMKESLIQSFEEMLCPPESIEMKDWPYFNNFIGGFREKEFSILCGSTGSGKTTFVANISRYLVSNQIPHFVASIETGHTDYTKRIISSIVKRNWNSRKKPTTHQMEEIKKFYSDYKDIFLKNTCHFSLYDNRMDVYQLMNDINWYVQKHKIKIAIIDNLNFFLDVTSVQNQIIEMDRVVHELIMFCKEIPIHMIMIMHPKKTDGGRVESEFDIKGSSTAVQEAHNVFLWNRLRKEEQEKLKTEDPHHPKLKNRELKIAKSRIMGTSYGIEIVFKTNDGVFYEEGGYY